MKVGLGVLLVSVAMASTTVPVKVDDPKGSFAGSIEVEYSGPANAVPARWQGRIKNTSDHKIFRVVFCVHAFDASGQILAGGKACLIELSANNWAPGAELNYKGKAKIKVDESKRTIAPDRMERRQSRIHRRRPASPDRPRRVTILSLG